MPTCRKSWVTSQSTVLSQTCATSPAPTFSQKVGIQRTTNVNTHLYRGLNKYMWYKYELTADAQKCNAALTATKEFVDKAKRRKDAKGFKGRMPMGEPHVHTWAALETAQPTLRFCLMLSLCCKLHEALDSWLKKMAKMGQAACAGLKREVQNVINELTDVLGDKSESKGLLDLGCTCIGSCCDFLRYGTV